MKYFKSDKRCTVTRALMCQLLFLLLFASAITITVAFGFDSSNTCSPNGKLSRRGRAQMLASIPCDLTSQAYCNLPGAAYPWHAVRRFVHENQGLMKRMYGDVRHISILRDEIQNNEINIDDVDVAADRYSKDGYRRSSKFMHTNDFGNLKSNEVLMEPHFRPVSTKSSTQTTSPTPHTTISTKEPTTEKPTSTSASLKLPSTEDSIEFSFIETNTSSTTLPTLISGGEVIEPSNHSNANFTEVDSTNSQMSIKDVEDTTDSDKSSTEDRDIALNSLYEAPTTQKFEILTGDNIQIIESPKLGPNNDTETATIPTTLKVATATSSETAQTIATTSNDIKQTPQDQQPPPQPQYQPQRQKADSTKIKESFNVPSNRNESESISAISSVKRVATTALKSHNHSHNNKNKHHNNSSTSLLSSTSSSLKTSADLLSGEKMRKPTISPATAQATATKPVLRDGQLFQDTMKQEPPPVVNIRGVNACPVKEEVVAPFWANNTRGEVLALLNLYPFEQYVHWEKCTHEHKQMYCRDGCRCEQQYRLHRLLAYDPHNECRGIFSDWFRFPSCCICKCYDISLDFRATSRSPRTEGGSGYKHPIETAEENVKKAIYEHATEEWYRPKDEFDFF